MVKGVYIAREPCHVAWMNELKCHFLLIALMRDIYLLYNINVDGNILSSLEDFYTLTGVEE
jgi:hypothetical protein